MHVPGYVEMQCCDCGRIQHFTAPPAPQDRSFCNTCPGWKFWRVPVKKEPVVAEPVVAEPPANG